MTKNCKGPLGEQGETLSDKDLSGSSPGASSSQVPQAGGNPQSTPSGRSTTGQWVVVEHSGHGPGHPTFMMERYDTKEAALDRISCYNAAKRKCGKPPRSLFVQTFREDGRYDLF